MAQKQRQAEKKKLSMQLESFWNMREESEAEERKLHRRLMDDCAKRKANGELIANTYHKSLFKNLCDLNEWLIENNINIAAADASGKLWFTEIDQIPFTETKYDKTKESPEFKQVSNFIEIMQREWIEKYFEHWNKGNDARRTFNQLAEKDTDMSK